MVTLHLARLILERLHHLLKRPRVVQVVNLLGGEDLGEG